MHVSNEGRDGRTATASDAEGGRRRAVVARLDNGVSVVEFATAYPRTFVPKGGSKVRTEFPVVKEIAAIRSPTRAEVKPAFRVSYPKSDFPDIPIVAGFYFLGYSRQKSPVVVELVEYEGALWWPCWRASYRNPSGFEAVGIEEWLDECGQDVAAVVPYGDATVEKPSAAREVIEDGHAETIAKAKRAMFENLLIVDDQVHVRGGIPLYGEIQFRKSKQPQIRVICSTVDRAVMPFRRGAYQPPGDFEQSASQAALYENRVWSPRADVSDRRSRAQRHLPKIEVLDFDVGEPALNASRLDALFRECQARIKNRRGRDYFGAGQIRAELSEIFVEAAKDKQDDYAISESRLKALAALFSHPRLAEHPLSISLLRPCYDELAALYSHSLAEEEETALTKFFA
jgi:hypothetical protein